MRKTDFRSRAITAVVAAAIASSLLTFLILTATGYVRPQEVEDLTSLGALAAIILIWGPAFALIPAGLIGFAVERPLSRGLIARGQGGFVVHLLAVLGAAAFLWLLLRIAVVVTDSRAQLVDHPSLGLFAVIGLCSAISWWFFVVQPERRG